MAKKENDPNKGTRKNAMRRLTMLAVLLAALVVASTGAVLAQNTTPDTKQGTTHKHPNSQQSSTPDTQQQGSSNDAPFVGNGPNAKTASDNATSGVSPQAVNNCGIQQGNLTGYNIYGPYTYDPSSGSDTNVGLNNHSLVYGYFVPQPPLKTIANFLVCKYDTQTGKENFTGLRLSSNVGQSFIDPPPSGNSFAIHDALLPPLVQTELGTGIYSVYEVLDPTGGASRTDFLVSQPHYVYVT